MVTKNMDSVEAGLVLEQIQYILERYKTVTLADIKDLMGESTNYKDNLIEWSIEDLPHIRIRRVGETEDDPVYLPSDKIFGDKYYIELPEIIR